MRASARHRFPAGLGAVIGVANVEPEARPIYQRLDLLAQVPYAQYDAGDSLRAKVPELPDDEWLAGNLDQRLGNRRRHRAQASRKPPAKIATGSIPSGKD